MKRVGVILVSAGFLALSSSSSWAQYGPPEVPARFDYTGSAHCPEGYDFRRGLCRARGYGGGYQRRSYRGYEGGGDDNSYGGGGFGGGVPARFNGRGSAVCPAGYDYIARRNACFPQ